MQTGKNNAGARLMRVQATGFEEASEQLDPLAHVRYVQLERGVARVEGAFAQLDATVVARFCGDRNKIARVDTDPGRLMVVVPTRGVGRLGTSSLRVEDVMLISSSTQFVVFTDRSFLPIVISAAEHRCRELAADLQVNARVLKGEIRLLRVSTGRVSALDRLTESLFESLSANAELLPAAARITTLEEAVLSWCVALLSSEQTQQTPAFDAATRRRAVLRAREFIDANLDQPLCLSLVCRASFSSARALEYGFREMFGVSPMTYARCARLCGVRHDLHRARALPKTVTHLAMKWGFVHLSQFSKDYRMLFGESPSQTLAHTNAAGGEVISLSHALHRVSRRHTLNAGF